MSDTVAPTQAHIFMSKIELDIDDEEHSTSCVICNGKRQNLNET